MAHKGEEGGGGGSETNVKAVEKLTEIPSKNVKKTLLLSKPWSSWFVLSYPINKTVYNMPGEKVEMWSQADRQ
jgi:hypothetical protein